VIQNERVKLSATYLNGIAIAVFAVGCFAPLIASFSSTGHGLTLKATMLTFGCFVLSLILHYSARTLLKGLQS
jgi:hypothetical protein